MTRINIKYPCGQKVNYNGLEGQVTAIFIRGKGRAYEFSFFDNNGNPSCTSVEECQLENTKENKLGFGRQNNE